jgi:hypothetical protein
MPNEESGGDQQHSAAEEHDSRESRSMERQQAADNQPDKSKERKAKRRKRRENKRKPILALAGFLKRHHVILQLLIPSFFNALIFLAIVTQAVIYVLQWHAMQSQLNEMRKSTQLDERAWIGITRIGGSPEVDKPWIATVTFKNSGKTFAKRVKTMIGGNVGPIQDAPKFFLEDNQKSWEREIESIVAPNTETFAHIAVGGFNKLTQKQVDQIMKGELTVFIHGRVIYRDIFDCEHWLTFCGTYEARTGSFTPCDKHNDSDNNRCP